MQQPNISTKPIKTMRKRIAEQFKLLTYRLTEFFCYTISGIDFYRNYERFYWKNAKLIETQNKQ